MPASPPPKPAHPPIHYVMGGWPHGTTRELSESEGGAFVRAQVEQVREFVVEVIDLREARGLSPAALARKARVRPNTISELEAGQSYPHWHTIARIAWALDADIRFVARRSVPGPITERAAGSEAGSG